MLSKGGEQRKAAENGAERFAKSQAAGTFRVVLDEVERGMLAGCRRGVGEIERVQAPAVVARPTRRFQGEQGIQGETGEQGETGARGERKCGRRTEQTGRVPK